MCRISDLLRLSRIRPATCPGETSDMHSSLIDALVEQVFTGCLGLFVHDKTSPNAVQAGDSLQQSSTFYFRYDAPEILIRCQHVTCFIKHGESHPVRVCWQHLVKSPDHVPIVVVMDCMMSAESDGLCVEHRLVSGGDRTRIYCFRVRAWMRVLSERVESILRAQGLPSRPRRMA